MQNLKRPTRLLVLSLGNPKEYDGTRHSVGHYILSKLILRYNCQNERVGRFESYVKRDFHGCDIWFYRVPGFMNLSGKGVTPFYDSFLKLPSNNNSTDNPIDNSIDNSDNLTSIVILFDELDVELGDVKIRKKNSSHRGHNGLRNIQQQSKIIKEYTGIQIGIGRNYQGDKNTPGVVANYVLSKFTDLEKKILDDQVVGKVQDIIENICEKGKYINDRIK